MANRIYSEVQKEVKRQRATEWYHNNKKQARETRQNYYLRNRQQILEKMREYALKHPSLNKECVERWRKNNPHKDPSKYRVVSPMRNVCIEMWGDTCPICGRKFEDRGYLKRIFHHIQYEPIEHIVILCYQCHNLIHSRKCYGHPFIKFAKEESPEYMAISILELHNRYLVLHRVLPRVVGRKAMKAKVYLHEEIGEE